MILFRIESSAVSVYTSCMVRYVSVFRLQERRQKRIIYVALVGSVLASVIWLIALCTTGWTELILPQPGVYLPSLRYDVSGHVVLVEKMWVGFWRQCRVERSNVTDVTDSVTEPLDTQKGIQITTAYRRI